MEYSSYDSYQPSRLEWLDVIPRGWDITRLRLISRRYAGGTPSKDKPEYWKEGTIPWLNSGAVNQGTITEPSEYITELGFKESSAKWIPEHAIIIALAGQGKTKGTAAYTTFKTTCNQSMGVVVFERDYPRYMYWWLVSQYKNIRGMASDDARDGLNLEMLGTIPCPLPSQEEQQKIAAFLDYKTQQIDQLIEKKKALIEKLEEKRIAVITQAVTKGLDKNVKLKPSDVDWLGDVPEHWDVRRIKFSFKDKAGAIKTGPFGSQLKSEDMNGSAYKIYNQRNVIQQDLSLGEEYINEEKYCDLSTFEVFCHDLLITTRGTIGRCIEIPENYEKGILHPCLMRLQLKNKVFLNKYFIWLLQESGLLLKELILSSNATTLEVIYSETLKNVTAPLPPLEEQQKIVEYLIKETKKIDDMKKRVGEAINHLNEYRSAIITSTVTGKIDVRAVPIPKEAA